MRSLLSVAALAVVVTSACANSTDDLEPIDPPATETDDAAVTSQVLPASSSEDIAIAVPDDAAEGSAVVKLEQNGTLPVTVDVVSHSGGQMTVVEGRDGELALRLPAFMQDKDPPRAVVRVTAREIKTDLLAPGEANFSFGADFRKDRASSGTEVDNGDNLIQRGLASDSSQYKIEVDRARPACRIMGSEGSVEVKAQKKVSSGRWYSVRCTRDLNTVTLDLIEYAPYGRVVESSVQAEGRIGSVTWPQTQMPLSIGGKLAANGSMIKSATDEFNGVISNPFLTIEGTR